ncbi:hypothetical protein KCU61_g233, partial [Aureobasidium melanogenum]
MFVGQHQLHRHTYGRDIEVFATVRNVESSADGSMVCPRWRREPEVHLLPRGHQHKALAGTERGNTAIKIALLREADPSSLVSPAQRASPEYIAGTILSVYRFSVIQPVLRKRIPVSPKLLSAQCTRTPIQ